MQEISGLTALIILNALVLRKDAARYIGRRTLTMELPGKMKRRRPTRRFMDTVREDMTAVEVTGEDAEERTEWRRRIHCGDPQREQPEEEDTDFHISIYKPIATGSIHHSLADNDTDGSDKPQHHNYRSTLANQMQRLPSPCVQFVMVMGGRAASWLAGYPAWITY